MKNKKTAVKELKGSDGAPRKKLNLLIPAAKKAYERAIKAKKEYTTALHKVKAYMDTVKNARQRYDETRIALDRFGELEYDDPNFVQDMSDLDRMIK